jgi:hypothetical protein
VFRSLVLLWWSSVKIGLFLTEKGRCQKFSFPGAAVRLVRFMDMLCVHVCTCVVRKGKIDCARTFNLVTLHCLSIGEHTISSETHDQGSNTDRGARRMLEVLQEWFLKNNFVVSCMEETLMWTDSVCAYDGFGSRMWRKRYASYLVCCYMGCCCCGLLPTYGLLNVFAKRNISLRNVLTGVRGQRLKKIIWPITTV